MKDLVIFLDVDGVLNTHETKTRIGGFLGVEPDICNRFRELVKQTDAKIVLSSTWRKHRVMSDGLWVELGPEMKARHIGDTPDLTKEPEADSLLYTGRSRGEEIGAWLARNPEVKRFVILDDMNIEGPLGERHVQTSFATGLTDFDCGCAIALAKLP